MNKKITCSVCLIGLLYFPFAHSKQMTYPQDSPSVPGSESSSDDQVDRKHWQSFLKLAEKPNAMVTIEDVKQYFPDKLALSNASEAYEIPGTIRYSESVPPRLHELYPGRKMILINLYFVDKDVDTCLKKDLLINDLQKAGWKVVRNLPDRRAPGLDGGQIKLPAEADLLKGDQGVLNIIDTGGCTSLVFMEANKLDFDKISH